jgi:histidinol-phosphate aminotransferase
MHDSAITPRAEIKASPAAHHGALDYTELEILGICPEELLDFSVNSNPFGTSPRVLEAMQAVPVDRYPDRDAVMLRRMLSRRYAMDPNRILVGNGTSELIQLISFAYLSKGDIVLILAPTFGEYQRSAGLMGAQVREIFSGAEQDFQVDEASLRRELQQHPPKIVFLCNPNNPTGTLLPADLIAGWAREFPRTLFVVDEAYMAFADRDETLITCREDNLLVLRSMTKDYALAGLRLGYTVGSEAVIEAVGRVRPAWNVNALAQAAGAAALQDEGYLQETLKKLTDARDQFRQELENLGAKLAPSAAHYFLVKVGNGAACRSELLKEYIQVRDCHSFDLPAYIRIATKQPQENSRLVAALQMLEQKRGSLIF